MDSVQIEEQRGDSPTFPEVSEAVIPMEAAVCASIIDSSMSESDGSMPASPHLRAAIHKELSGVSSSASTIVTDKMREEEERLHEEGLKKEEERIKENQKLLDEVDETTEMRYERLKYLLSKSTLYTEYLVGRMKKQKEEQEKKKEKLMKRKSKVQDTEKTSGENSLSLRQNQSRKRTSEEISDKPSKRSRKEKKQPLQEASADENDEQCIGSDKDGEQKPTEGTGDVQEPEPEPALLEKAVTSGVEENEDAPRIINGEEVSALQPQLMDGGVLRPYQVEGYSWLKILYENGVNGILADEMGLGKTVQCVAMLSHLVKMGVPGPFLVCAPLSTIPNWLSEFQRFAPKVPTVLYHGGKNQRMNLVRKIRLRHKVEDGLAVKPVVITSYEIAMIDRRFLAYFEWKYLIVDEGHRIKNTNCRLVRELRLYHSTHRLLLTGTPLQNNLAELWSMLNFLLPEIFDDKGSFEMWFDANCINDQSSEEQIVRQEQGRNILGMLHQILSPFMLRRLKSDVDLCIPPKKEVLVYAPLTKEQKQYYSALVDRTIFSFLEGKSEKPEEKVELNAAGHPKRRSASRIVDYSMMIETKKEKESYESKPSSKTRGRPGWKALEEDEKELESWVHAMNTNHHGKSLGKLSADDRPKTSQVTIKMRNVMMQLRKCCNHPYLLEHPLDPKTGDLALTEDVVKTSGKMLVLDQMLKELKKRGHKVLIFSQMTRQLDLIEDYCQIRGFEFCRLDGSTKVDDRRDSMSVFNDKTSDKFVFLLSTRAGGLGINLTGADTVIIYDSDWNPQCDLQAQDRCHRIGQTKPVVVYRFITANTIDQKIIERAAGKRKLEKMVIHKGKFKSGNFINKPKPISPEELRDLLQSKDHTAEIKNERFVINPSELEALLDRSDLYLKWEKGNPGSSKSQTAPAPSSQKSKRRSAKTAGRQKDSELFKVMDTDKDDKDSTQADTEIQGTSDGESTSL